VASTAKLANPILAFANKAEFEAKLGEVFASGKNLIRMSRKKSRVHGPQFCGRQRRPGFL
jgi:hypothetical protein